MNSLRPSGIPARLAGIPARRARLWIVLALASALLATAALAALHRGGGSADLPLASPTADPHLIVHAQTVPIAGILDGTAVHGTLYPGMPGGNTVRISAPSPESPGSASYLVLLVNMPGMRMVPVTATLPALHGVYSGVVPLPMFGSYTARLTLVRGAVRLHGTARLNLPLSLGH